MNIPQILINGGEFGTVRELPGPNQSLLALDPRLSPPVKRALREVVEGGSRPGKVWILSSGTTMAPDTYRLVQLSWAALLASAQAVNQHLRVDAHDHWLLALPDFHVGGLSVHVRAQYLRDGAFAPGSRDGAFAPGSRHDASAPGAGIPVTRAAGNNSPWSPERYLESAHTSGATLSALVPTQVYDLVVRGLRCPRSLRAVVIGGQALPPALYLKARELGWPLLPSYGLTEACSQVATAPLDSLGQLAEFPPLQLLPHIHATISPDGLLHLRGESLCEGYWFVRVNEGELQSAEFVDPRQDNWLTTSDRAAIEGADGGAPQLRILGRSGDAVKIGGELVERSGLEDALLAARLALGLVSDAAVRTVPDERLGHRVELDVEDEKAAALLLEKYNSKLPPYAHARAVHVVPRIDRTVLGKQRR